MGTERVARVVRQCLAEGRRVQIDGLGTFLPEPRRGCQFVPRRALRVFLAYVQEDAEKVERLFDALEAGGFAPWMDRRKLLPGQNWPRSIEEAIEMSDFFIACFSTNSVNKRGGFQSEIRWALDCARRVPLDSIFLIPVRLDDCRVPRTIRRELQYLDLFPAWSRGVRRLVGMLRREMRRRAPHPLPGE
jgi:hypothetical protein